MPWYMKELSLVTVRFIRFKREKKDDTDTKMSTNLAIRHDEVNDETRKGSLANTTTTTSISDNNNN